MSELTIAEKIERAKADYDAVYEAGKQEEYDRFWDIFQQNGNRRDYSYAFGGYGWTDETFKPKYDIVFDAGWRAMAFRTCGITDLYANTIGRGIKIDTSQATSLPEMFAYSYNLERIPPLDISNCISKYSMFAFCVKLVTIDELTVSENTVWDYSDFQDDSELVNLIIKGTIGQNGLNLQWSKKLSKASITSIINALSTTKTGLSVTLSQTAVNNAFTTEEWQELAATRSNWTISLIDV